VSPLTISEVARQVGLQASAIRYYEEIGLLPPAARLSGQRRYDMTAVHRLAVVQRARQLGFTLGEIRLLFFGFRDDFRASQRWQKLSRKKLEELDTMMSRIRAMQRLLNRMNANCRCETLNDCGKAIFRRGLAETVAKSPAVNRHSPRPGV